MMNHLMRYSCLLLCLSAGLTACDDDGIDVLDIEIPEGYALSAGTSTIFMNSSKAYDSPADWVSGVYNSRFNDGDGLYDDVRTSSNGMGGGLARSMRGILVAVVIVMPAVPNRRCGVKADRVVTGFPRCWFI
mgnify:CR=1 FL=1